MSINAFKRLMDSSRKVQSGLPQKRMKNEEVSEKSKSSRSGKQFWKSGLNAAMNDADNVIDSSENIVIIKDKYPKVSFIPFCCESPSLIIKSYSRLRLTYFTKLL